MSSFDRSWTCAVVLQFWKRIDSDVHTRRQTWEYDRAMTIQATMQDGRI